MLDGLIALVFVSALFGWKMFGLSSRSNIKQAEESISSRRSRAYYRKLARQTDEDKQQRDAQSSKLEEKEQNDKS